MKTYTIESSNGDRQTAKSMGAAMTIARTTMGQRRLYRGARYQSDRHNPAVRGELEACDCLDIWSTRKEAVTQQNVSAPVVISW